LKDSISRCAVIILAAGSSSRLGKPKQLLKYNGESLLQHMLGIAMAADVRPIIVVLGANGLLISKEIKAAVPPSHIVFNGEWREGIASSVRSGIRALQGADPLADGVILAVCDQPYVTTNLLNSLLAEQGKSGSPIVASAYERGAGVQVIGTPVLFHKSMYPELMALKGDTGAKKLIRQYTDSVATVPFPGGDTDIDTEADYAALPGGE
jgi:molybdenum cofactor cytidylyltransferase